ncbi:MAG: GNAT family N-acetyltransferase [Gammaproteobacteria bacterium]|nr:MAG: GNAT family N-acetyltransferase [Gammaproteobacteria bacterium]RLA51670.1 MAG: GNAT family N-acetyltransferase [Gammaproteobacteria bacterium]
MDTFPKEVELRNGNASLHLMSAQDSSDMLAFAKTLPAHDLLFLRRDILQPKVVESWVKKIETGANITIIAAIDGNIVGYGTLSQGDIDWSRHVAELRIMVGPNCRETGIGRTIVRELFRLALVKNIEKIYARMTLDQTGARKLFQELGFRPEALLENEVKDREGKVHDVLSMAVDVETFLARRDSYGLN